MRLPTPRILAILLSLACLASLPAGETDLEARADDLLDTEGTVGGPLELSATVSLLETPASRPDLLGGALELRLPAEAAAGGRLDLVILPASFEGAGPSIRLTERLPPAGRSALPRLRVLFEMAEETDRVIVAVAFDGLWGAVDAELTETGAHEEGDFLAEWDLRPGAAPPAAPPVLRLLPPVDQPVTGRGRIRVLISDPAVAWVAFELDGHPAGEDRSAPFSAKIDFGDDAAPREIRAVAYDRANRPLGEDRLTVNDRSPGGRVRITRLVAGPDAVSVGAALELAAGTPPPRLDFYLNERRLARLEAPPWRAELPRPEPAPSDFVRVVAVFADGSEVEDARLVEGDAERVEVNLVQVFAVVTDRDGTPRRDLERDDFEVRLAGRPQPIDRFAPAEEVPLVLGLVIDTSGSMWTLMPDTRQAGSTFLARTLRAGDRAFLVDFDSKPRLAAGLTDDVGSLLRRFAGLTADGYTALYDAVIFSMLQFEREGGRKALVVLTDGDDYRSRFGAKRCIEYGRELGVPVYIIALGGMFGERRDIKKLDLEALSGSTGGRVFYIRGEDPASPAFGDETAPAYGTELGAAYDLIQEELRSQYLLAFTSDRPLSPDELGRIRIQVRPRGLRVRAVAGVE